MGQHVALVEDFGWRGRLSQWAGPVSQGTEAVNVYLSPASLKQELSVFRDGERLAFIDGDEPESIEGGDEAGVNRRRPGLPCGRDRARGRTDSRRLFPPREQPPRAVRG
jgi:hypothetical protein